MRRILIAVCLLAHSSTYGAPQRGVQLGGPGGPRPVTYGSPQGGPTAQPNFGPSYSQQLTFGPSDASRARGPGSYQSPQPILLQQGNPTGAPQFAGFPSSTPFTISSPGRGTLRGVGTTASPADDEEYEEYEDEEEAPKQIQNARPIQRTPVRVSQPISFSQGPQRLVVPQQSQPQAPIRQRQPVPQRQPAPSPQQYSPQPQPQRVQSQAPAPQQSRGQQIASYGLDGKRTRLTTPSPVQTVNRYMRQNDDGSITWGYENEDGTFKEETIGADCVVRGKYGYVDPDGQKREYEYQSGNPCDPNKKDQEEEEEELREGPGPQQQLAGVIAARPRPQQQQQRRPAAIAQQRPIQQQQQQQYQPQSQFA